MTSVTYSKAESQRGLSLVELLVALAIGAVLIFGATQVYVNGRGAYETNETVARLQENARYALSVLEPDVRLANYWGFVKGASAITGQGVENGAPAAVASGALANACGNNLAVDLNQPIKGYDNRYRFIDADAPSGDCDSLSGWNTTPVATADTLIIRRASITATNATNGVLQVCTNRQNGFLFSDGGAARACSDANPADAPADRAASVNNLIAHAYYVDQNSDGRPGVPSLRRKSLSGLGFIDEEVISGVEDMQVQFGIETGTNTPTVTPITGEADQYVNPEDVDLAVCNCQVVAVRFWLVVRADAAEVGFIDARIYAYGDRTNTASPTADLNDAADTGNAFQPSLSGDTSPVGMQHVRRLLVTRTIQLRNAWGT